MGSVSFNGGNFRKLWNVEPEEFRDHLMRLSSESRNRHFGAEVTDTYIEDSALHERYRNFRLWGFYVPLLI